MLNFHITVNDNGELKTITPEDIRAFDALGEFQQVFDNLLSSILDHKSALEAALPTEPDTWADLVEQANRVSDEPDPVLDPAPAPEAPVDDPLLEAALKPIEPLKVEEPSNGQ